MKQHQLHVPMCLPGQCASVVRGLRTLYPFGFCWRITSEGGDVWAFAEDDAALAEKLHEVTRMALLLRETFADGRYAYVDSCPGCGKK